MSENITLKGITWNHSRGFVSMPTTARRFALRQSASSLPQKANWLQIAKVIGNTVGQQ